MKALLIGGGGREHAIGLSIVKSGSELCTIASNKNPGLMRISKKFILDRDVKGRALEYAKKNRLDIAFIGPEGPISEGISDTLLENGIRTFSPTLKAAKLETSKSFCRIFMEENHIDGNVENRMFSDVEEAEKYIKGLDSEYVIKPDGLTSGKGVMVQGFHFSSVSDAMEIIRRYLQRKNSRVLIEKKMTGEEFSLQGFVFEKTIEFMPIVQDYKRAYDGDKGPNTGGMGSISFSERGLPFISKDHVEKAKKIMRDIVAGISDQGTPYIGPIYGQFMATRAGPKLIEINARMGDPEAINTLSLMQNSIFEVAIKMYNREKVNLEFKDKVNVVKYVVPIGYGSISVPSILTVEEEKLMIRGIKVIFASVNASGNHLRQTTSRTMALVSEEERIEKASANFEKLDQLIQGQYFMRNDIGKLRVLKQKVKFMDQLLAK